MKDKSGNAPVDTQDELSRCAAEGHSDFIRDDEHGSPEPTEDQLTRNGRRYSVANQRGKARARFRYVESNHPAKGCRFF